jgi:Tol biopolymer transport system component
MERKYGGKQMKKHSILIVVLVVVAFSFGNVMLQNGHDLFQKALAKERAEGNPEEAITLYQKVIAESEDKSLAAKAQLRIGICYEILGKQEAKKAYQKVIDYYPNQLETVKAAREKLSILLESRFLNKKDDQGFIIRPIWSEQELKDLPGKGIGIQNPRPSPNGKYISFVDWSTGVGNLYIQERTGGKLKCLTKRNSAEKSIGDTYGPIWSPDSKHIAYTWENDEADYVDLRIIGLTNSKPRILHRGEYVNTWVGPMDWSPDGKHILAMLIMSGNCKFELIPLEGGTPQVLKIFSNIEGGNDPAGGLFSPDGRYIAYDSPQRKDVVNHDIYLLSSDNGEERIVVSHPSHDYILGWGPDSSSLIFASDRMGSVDLWTLSVKNGRPQGKPSLLIRNIGFISPLDITSEGSFYFNRDTAGIKFDIYTATLDPDSGETESPPEKLALPYEGGNVFPEWSPDGKTLAYVSRRRPLGQGILCLYSTKTGKIRDMFFRQMISDPHWSADGRSLLVIDWNAKYISKIDIDTEEIIPLIKIGEEQEIYSAVISPDMNYLFYVWHDRDDIHRIIRKNLKTGNELEIYSSSILRLQDIELSADGSWVAAVRSENPYETGEIKHCITVFPSSGGKSRDVYEFVQPGRWGLIEIDWSPDGLYIFFSKIAEEQPEEENRKLMWELWRVPSDGGRAQKLGLKMKRFRSLSIHPDGRRIAFFSHGIGEKQPPSFWVMENFLPEVKEGKEGEK